MSSAAAAPEEVPEAVLASTGTSSSSMTPAVTTSVTRATVTFGIFLPCPVCLFSRNQDLIDFADITDVQVSHGSADSSVHRCRIKNCRIKGPANWFAALAASEQFPSDDHTFDVIVKPLLEQTRARLEIVRLLEQDPPEED